MSAPVRASCTCTSAVLIRAGALVCGSCGAPIASDAAGRPYTQRDTSRPPGCGRPKYLRTHARAVEANDPGAWSEGRTRCMTPEAWARWARTSTRPPAKTSPPVPNREDEILFELGAKKAS